jgi:arylsulfatase A-like enzyme
MNSRQPNILLVMVDNQPASMMGCYGNDEIFSPHLDTLASNGVLFRNTFCPNAMCSPSRASMFTGLMPSQHGIHTWLDDDLMDTWPEGYNAIDEFETLPETLAKKGYQTAMIGKYHLGHADEPQNGFKHWVAMEKGTMESFYGVPMIENGQRHIAPEHAGDYFTKKSLEYLDQHAGPNDPPFFLSLTYVGPYANVPDKDHRFSHLYADLPMNSVPREGLSSELLDWILLCKEKLPADEFEWYKRLAMQPNALPAMRRYYSEVSMVDDGVGQVLAKLKEKGVLENTLIIYTADHGKSVGHHGFWGHGEDTWPSNMHHSANSIPLLVSYPGFAQAGLEVDNLVGTTDIFATILDLADCKLESPEAVTGESFSTLLSGETTEFRDEVFMEQEETRAIRTSKWLFMKRLENTQYGFKDELYDLVNDPDERRNLAQQPDCADVVSKLSKRLDDYFFQYANPRWDLWKGGVVKSNSTRPFLWKEVWGDDWAPDY